MMGFEEAIAQVRFEHHAVRRRCWSTLQALVWTLPGNARLHSCRPSTWSLVSEVRVEPFVGLLHRGGGSVEFYVASAEDKAASDWERLVFEKDRKP